MARKNSTTQQAAAAKPAKGAKPAKVAKVAKLDKGAKASAAKSAKASKQASGQQARTGRKSQFSGMKIKNVSGSDAPCRGGAAIRFDTIVSFKNVDDAIGATYTDTDGSERAITSADIAYLVNRELIEVA